MHRQPSTGYTANVADLLDHEAFIFVEHDITRHFDENDRLRSLIRAEPPTRVLQHGIVRKPADVPPLRG